MHTNVTLLESMHNWLIFFFFFFDSTKPDDVYISTTKPPRWLSQQEERQDTHSALSNNWGLTMYARLGKLTTGSLRNKALDILKAGSLVSQHKLL